MILHVMDWADNFGANILPLTEKLYEVEAEAETAVGYYLEQDYATTIASMEEVTEKISAITREAVDLKDEAMFWVFLSEWLTITSTGVVAGTVVWSLMIRRRVYRAVGTTRLREV